MCRLVPTGMRLAWEERFLSMPELIEAVAPGRDVKADPWLFRRLTRVLDRRMLSILSDAAELRGAGPFSITLNVASVLGPEFLRFDATLPSALRDRVVIGMLPADVAADAGAFAFARNFARARSYRLCLRAVTAALLPVLDLPRNGARLRAARTLGRSCCQLRALPDPGPARWVLGRPCDGCGDRVGQAGGHRPVRDQAVTLIRVDDCPEVQTWRLKGHSATKVEHPGIVARRSNAPSHPARAIERNEHRDLGQAESDLVHAGPAC